MADGDRSRQGIGERPRPVATAKTRSPSNIVWAGTMARASPSCAASAMRCACVLVSVASVATMAIVVAVPGSRALSAHRWRRTWARGHARRTPRPSRRARPRTRAPSPWVTSPTAFTATSAPTVVAILQHQRGRPEPALQRRGQGPGARPGGAEGEIRRCRAKGRRAQGGIGRDVPALVAAVGQIEQDRGRARWAPDCPPAANPRPAARSAAVTPEAASSPKADPPDRTSASTRSTVLSGARRSVSRVPGAPPMTWTAAVNGAVATSGP